MKTCTFTIWIPFLILFWHGVLSKSPTNNEHYSIDSENSKENPEIDIERQDVAVQESFRPRHKYKANGHHTRVYRSNSDSGNDQESKAPHCAVMYKDNEPVGILQPFKESYRFLPVSGDPTLVDINPIPVKRRTIMDVLYPSKISEDYNDETAENNQFTDDRYPSIFAKFKIDSRLDKTLNPDLNLKRSMYKRDTEKPEISDEQVSSLKTTLSKMNGDNSAVVEEELKDILDDMGLIDDYDGREAKREVSEDEDMEQGTNKINLVKEEHGETRGKRGDSKSTTEKGQSVAGTKQPALATTASAMPVPTKARFEEERTEEMDSIDLLNGDAKLNDNAEKEELDVSTEGERKKRQFENEEDMNKGKRDDTDTLPESNVNTPGLAKEAELSKYEKRVEREIRDKIERLKDEVKEEIMNLKKNSQINGEEPDNRRRKRQVMSTLLDEENREIDPNFSDEVQPQKHHVRRKRSLEFHPPDLVEYESKKLVNPSKGVQTLDLKGSSNFNNSSESTTVTEENEEGRHIVINFGGVDPVIQGVTQNESQRIELPIPESNLKGGEVYNNNSSKNEKFTQITDNSHVIRSVSNNEDNMDPVNETKMKKNIIKILNVIGKKANIQNKRFIGINPILQNNKSRFNDHDINQLKRDATDGLKRNIEPKSDKIMNRSDTTKNVKRLNYVNVDLKDEVHYNSRHLKQFQEETIATTAEDELVAEKRSDEQDDTIKNHSSDSLHKRVKRQAKENSEGEYQYDNSEFNEDDSSENQAYDYQPYANDNNVADNQAGNAINNINPHCNCDKTGMGCKCGTQKTDISVPNIKQEYSDYEDNLDNVVEKKSVKHCHCDKNGKHCKCSSFGQGSQYDYVEGPLEKSADIAEDTLLDEVKSDIRERGPRRPRQRRKHALDSARSVNQENLAEDYYDNYEMGTGRLMKREVEPKRRAENQRFQNGEYFVDLHPNTYRLTPMDTVREKRDNLKDLIAIHSGGPAMSHLAAVRQRSMLPLSRIRRRIEKDDTKEPRQLIDMSDEDIFGALPQSFAGELARYKRVKRGKIEK